MSKNLQNKHLQGIGIFPLNLVLFPGTYYPLHIFEPRYKQLINDVKDNNSFFCINYIGENGIKKIGCTAKLYKILKTYPNEEMDIVVEGDKRLSLMGEPYLDDKFLYHLTDLDFIEDEIKEFDQALFDEVFALFSNMVQSIYSDSVVEKNFVEQNSNLLDSYKIATKIGLEPPQKQFLLEMRSENQRLLFIRDYLKLVLPQIEKFQFEKRIHMNNGYYFPKI